MPEENETKALQDNARGIDALRRIAREIASAASEIIRSPHYETVKTEITGDAEETLSLIRRTTVTASDRVFEKLASALRQSPGTRFIRTTNYDTDVNRYAKLCLVRASRLLASRFPDEHLDRAVCDVLATPFFSAISSDRTPRRVPNAFRMNRTYRRLADGLSFLTQIAELYQAHGPEALEEAEQSHPFPLDVLVGAFRSAQQFEINFAKHFYYVPAELYGETERPRYIALYQSSNLFGADAAIRYYGEITSVERVPRAKIPVPYDPRRATAPYVLFRVKEWVALEKPILPRLNGPLAMRRTSFFLLTHARYSYELFDIYGETEFRLLEALRLSVDTPDTTVALANGLTVRNENGRIDVRHADGEFAIEYPISAEYFLKHPLRAYHKIRSQIKL
ncbi:MAG: hypothetical protein J6B77_05290 [Clostridia bacterium]|nr:hypothetical protein [Clostridia bacterium]